jgi:excinuclease UvrABC nuclease subunit
MSLSKTPIIISSFNKNHRPPDGFIKNLMDEDSFRQLPSARGAYLIVSNSQEFLYPKGKSRIIYIGKSKNLKSRLTTHRRHTFELIYSPKPKRAEFLHFARYQYMASYGAQIYWYTTRGTQDEGDLEKRLLDRFYDRYLSLPIANGANSYRGT